MLSQMDPALVAYCDKIAAQGGPMRLPDDMAGYTFTFPSSNPVVQLGRTVSRASALLHNVHQLEVNLDQSYDGAIMKRPKKNADIATLATASTAEDKSRHHQDSQLQQSHLRNPIRRMTQIILKGEKPLLLMVISMKLLQKMS